MVVITLMVAGGCGVETESSPRAIPTEDVPFGLLTPETSAGATSTTAASTAQVVVYFVRAERLVRVERSVAGREPLAEAVGALLAGPTGAETEVGLRTAIAAGVGLRSIAVDRGVASVDLGGGFGEIAGQEQILSVAQVVFTVTATSGVRGVRIAVDGSPVEAPRGDGTLTKDPLSAADFPDLVPGDG